MSTGFIDMHTHSNVSDGTDSPGDLVRKAARKRLCAVALTDHDTLAGLDEAEAVAKECGLQFVRGVEIATGYHERELHLVGYFPPRNSFTLQEMLDKNNHTRAARNERMVANLRELGFAITLDEVLQNAGEGSVGRMHIAAVMLQKKYVSSFSEAFENFLSRRGIAYARRTLVSPQEALPVMASLGMTVSLAHPCLRPTRTPYPCLDKDKERLDGLFEELAAYGLTAVEAYHSSHDAEAVRLCVDLAAKHGLLLTGGSDYHGKRKKHIHLGAGGAGGRVGMHVLTALLEYRKKHGLPLQ